MYVGSYNREAQYRTVNGVSFVLLVNSQEKL